MPGDRAGARGAAETPGPAPGPPTGGLAPSLAAAPRPTPASRPAGAPPHASAVPAADGPDATASPVSAAARRRREQRRQPPGKQSRSKRNRIKRSRTTEASPPRPAEDAGATIAHPPSPDETPPGVRLVTLPWTPAAAASFPGSVGSTVSRPAAARGPATRAPQLSTAPPAARSASAPAPAGGRDPDRAGPGLIVLVLLLTAALVAVLGYAITRRGGQDGPPYTAPTPTVTPLAPSTVTRAALRWVEVHSTPGTRVAVPSGLTALARPMLPGRVVLTATPGFEHWRNVDLGVVAAGAGSTGPTRLAVFGEGAQRVAVVRLGAAARR